MNLVRMGILVFSLVWPWAAWGADVCDPSVLCGGRNDDACHFDEGECLARTYGIEGCRRKRISCGAMNFGCWITAGHCYAAARSGDWKARCTDLGLLCDRDRALMCQHVQGACLAHFGSAAACDAFQASGHCGKIPFLGPDPGRAMVLRKCRSIPAEVRNSRASRPPPAPPGSAAGLPRECHPDEICEGYPDEVCHQREGECLARRGGRGACQVKYRSCGPANPGCWKTVGACFGALPGGGWEGRCTNLDAMCGRDRLAACHTAQGVCLYQAGGSGACGVFEQSRHCGRILGIAGPGCAATAAICRPTPGARAAAERWRLDHGVTLDPAHDRVLGRRFVPGDPGFAAAFPKTFLFGAATSAHQVEGRNFNNDWFAYEQMCRDPKLAGNVDLFFFGRLTNLCDRFELVGEAVRHREPAVLDADLDRARGLGLNAYRFSLEWSRIEPQPGRFDEGVIRACRRDLEAMRRRGLEPVVTLHHFTLPLWVSDPMRGKTENNGFRNPDSIRLFRRFAKRVVSEYADVVRYWVTVNEPVGSEFALGYIVGIWPPGRALLDLRRQPLALRNMVLAHAAAYDEIHAIYRRRLARPMVGFAHAMMYVKVSPPTWLGSLTPNHTEAARNFHFFINDLFIDAVHEGCFRLGRSDRCDEPLRAQLRRRLDFVGINYYRSVYVFHDNKVFLLSRSSPNRMIIRRSASRSNDRWS